MWLLQLQHQCSFWIHFRSRYDCNSCFLNTFGHNETLTCCFATIFGCVFHNRCYLSFWTCRFFLDENEEGKAFLPQQTAVTDESNSSSCSFSRFTVRILLEQQYCPPSSLVCKCVADCLHFQSVAQLGAELPQRSYVFASGCLVKTLAGQVSEVSRRMQQ